MAVLLAENYKKRKIIKQKNLLSLIKNFLKN